MKLRFAEEKDLPAIIALAKEWVSELGLEAGNDCEEVAKDVLYNGRIILVEDDMDLLGVMGMEIKRERFTGKKLAGENCLFVKKDRRGNGVMPLLLSAFESLAKELGCEYSEMNPNALGCMKIDALSSAFKRMGYETFGYQMRKKIDVR